MASLRTYCTYGQNVFVALCAVFQVARADEFTMLSTDQHYIIDTGGQVTLHCEFYKDNFNLFDNPVQWKKAQYGEVTEINIMGNIKDPFEATRRFKVTYEAHPPKHTLVMTIINISRIDSGNYTCEVKGPRSAELGRVRYTIFTREPVDDISIVYGNTSRVVHGHAQDEPTLTLIENDPTPVRCVSRGGSPPPQMEIFIDQKEYTNHFRFESRPSSSGQASFRLLQIITMLVTDDFRATLHDDGKTLHCVAKVTGMDAITKSATIRVNYEPIIQCAPLTAKEGDIKQALNCSVTSRPPVTSWHWVLDDRGTTISKDEVIDGYWTGQTWMDSTLHLQLYIREAKPQTFRRYALVARNAVGSKVQHVALRRRPRNGESAVDDDEVTSKANDQPRPKSKRPAKEQEAYISANAGSSSANTATSPSCHLHYCQTCYHWILLLTLSSAVLLIMKGLL